MFANRRKARKIGVDEEDHDTNGVASESNESAVKKPTTKPKQRSKLRLSYGPGGTSMTDDADEEETVIIPKKKLGARSGILRTSSQHRPRPTLGHSEDLPIRMGNDDNRPSYTREYLQELRDATPSAPKTTVTVHTSDDEKEKSLDIAAKFGEIAKLAPSGSTVIPSEAEIREKKERRARLAKEQEYISLNDVEEDKEDDWTLSRKEKSLDTRLVPDDEDFAEGFDEYVEDGGLALGKKAEREQERRRREEMKELIEGEDEISDEDDSEAERRAAYENAQTRAAMDGLNRQHLEELSRPKTPPKISSIPRLSTCLANLRATLTSMEATKLQLVQRLDELRQQKVEIADRETEIKKLLKEAGEKYEKLRAEAGLAANGQKLLPDRGLENLGAVSLPPSRPNGDEV
ncbi:hypothetical protein VTO42DRAFT_5264 [Malbranchea cinnamomea]